MHPDFPRQSCRRKGEGSGGASRYAHSTFRYWMNPGRSASVS